jgi:hypothetical protein
MSIIKMFTFNLYKKVVLPEYAPRSIFGEFRVWHPVTRDNQIHIDLEAENKQRSSSMSPVFNEGLEKEKLGSKRSHTEKFDKSCDKKAKTKVQTGNFNEELKTCNICLKKFVNLQKHQKNGNCKQLTKESLSKEFEQEDQNVVCKGCSKQFTRLQVHLKSKNGAICKEFYNENELNQEKQNKLEKNKARIMNKKKMQYDENKEEILRKRKVCYDENKEEMLRKKKDSYNINKDEILRRKQDSYDKNKDKILRKRKGCYDENKEKFLRRNKDFYNENKEVIRETKKKRYTETKLEKVKEKRKNLSMDDCLKLFRKEIVWGSIYPCISCHRACFRNGVVMFKLSNFENIEEIGKFLNLKLVNSDSQFVVKNSRCVIHARYT